MKYFPVILMLVSVLYCNAQQSSGVWEGKVQLTNKRKDDLTLRMELIIQGNHYFGMLYTRGVDKSTVYGCDYIISGNLDRNKIEFRNVHIQRAVAMSSADCGQMATILFNIDSNDSLKQLRGNWFWLNGESVVLNCTKVADSISDIAVDEIENYRTKIYQLYEATGIMLNAEDRLPLQIFETETDSSGLVVEITGEAGNKDDLIDVYFNGEPVAEAYLLSEKKLRVKLLSISRGVNDLAVINRSKVNRTVVFIAAILQGNRTQTVKGESSFTKNAVILIRYKGQ